MKTSPHIAELWKNDRGTTETTTDKKQLAMSVLGSSLVDTLTEAICLPPSVSLCTNSFSTQNMLAVMANSVGNVPVLVQVDASTSARTFPALLDAFTSAGTFPVLLDACTNAETFPALLDAFISARIFPALLDACANAGTFPALLDALTSAGIFPALLDACTNAGTFPDSALLDACTSAGIFPVLVPEDFLDTCTCKIA